MSSSSWSDYGSLRFAMEYGNGIAAAASDAFDQAFAGLRDISARDLHPRSHPVHARPLVLTAGCSGPLPTHFDLLNHPAVYDQIRAWIER